jgi:DNA-binding HxlR family transcriptional regulator
MTTQNARNSSEPLERISDIVHQKSRLAILATLNESGTFGFNSLKQVTKLTDGNLSRHLEVLEKAGLVTITKTFVGKRPRTTITLTDEGLRSLKDEVAIMQEFLESVQAAQHKHATSQNPQPGYSAG